MPRGKLLAALAIALVCACGAKTPLLLPGQGGQTGAGSGSGGAVALATPCSAALLAGAPTPMQGYCPTRAGQATKLGPTAPKVAWTAAPFAIDNPEDYLPAEAVVDASGRAYVAVNASPLNPAGGPNRIAAIDPDGTVVWTQGLKAAATDLALGTDGTLWFLVAQGDYGTLVGLGPDGSSHASAEIGTQVDAGPYFTPTQYDTLAIGSDGSFFVGDTGNSSIGPSGGGLAHLAPDGALLWQTSTGGADYVAVTSPVTLTSDDELVGWGTQVVELDSSGQLLWQQGTISGVPAVVAVAGAVDADDHLVVLGTVDNAGPLALVTLDGTGAWLQTTPLDPTEVSSNAQLLALAGDGTALVLLASEATSPGSTKTHVQVIAVDGSGQTRWTTGLDASLPYDPATIQAHYGLFVDGGGTVVVTAGVVTGLDLSTGVVLWTLQPPNASACLRPVVLGAGAALVGTQCDGTVFLARDP